MHLTNTKTKVSPILGLTSAQERIEKAKILTVKELEKCLKNKGLSASTKIMAVEAILKGCDYAVGRIQSEITDALRFEATKTS